jgi:hypothetical protein
VSAAHDTTPGTEAAPLGASATAEAWFSERERRERWYRTRDAALTGLLANAATNHFDGPTIGQIAQMHADYAHGQLNKEPQP